MKKDRKRFIIILIFILICLFILVKVVKLPRIILEQIYPLQYEEYVEEYAKEYKVDEALIYAMIKAESNFDQTANSSSGAKGLMQIMDGTVQEIITSLGLDNDKTYDLYDAQTNIMLGTKYFSNLLKDYDNNQYLALAAYNAGKGNVRKWIEKGVIKENGSDIENIPFKETNIYVRKILQNYRIYKELYIEKWKER